MRLIGQEGLEDQLHQLVANRKVNRTFLFLGQKDSGKTFCGKFFASLILDNRVFRNAHPDFFYFKGNRGKYSELLEEFLTACDKQPFEKKNVVVFFDDIDLIPLVSLNTLLKTLEEPSPKTTIILSAHSQETLLDTIISRSFKINLLSRTRRQKEEILFDLGVKDGSYRLSISDDIKICVSKDFKLLEDKVNACFKFYDKFLVDKKEDLVSDINECIEKVDLRFFFESIKDKDSSLEFQKEVNACLVRCNQFNNKFVLLFNFVMFIRDGLKTA